ncbi:hypothetical protein C8R46DRAFT_1054528 [Mycena filopes]|nr:hypothetical protein C8R46DRAFT_1054528 [Mycena filopes]
MPSPSKNLKRKPASTPISAKLDVKNAPKSKTKGKGKARETDAEAQFRTVQASLVVSVPPMFASNPHAGVQEMLDSMVMSPHIRMKLVGKINLCSPDHISLLLHRTFNVSIPRHHIPTEEWEFEHAPADAEPDEPAADVEPDEAAPEETAQLAEQLDGKETGSWVHKITGEKLGGENGYLEFTVIGLTVANEMLSLVGSIQYDPFSPEHVVIPAKLKVKKTTGAVEDTGGIGGR